MGNRKPLDLSEGNTRKKTSVLEDARGHPVAQLLHPQQWIRNNYSHNELGHGENSWTHQHLTLTNSIT